MKPPSIKRAVAAGKPSPKAKPKSAAVVAKPQSASRQQTILLAVSGMSPAILTETVWALAHENPPVIPHEVIVITTTKGRDDLRQELQTPRPEWSGATVWASLRDRILGPGSQSDPRLMLAQSRVIELPDRKSGLKSEAHDLRTKADNAAAADFILEEVRRLVENPDRRIVASIAGGRKTMGALLYACMSLLGRETDRLTHVLVSEPFDRCRGFFFPEQPDQDLADGLKDKQVKLRACNATIDLADIPFVPLRNRFVDLAELPGAFGSLVDRYARQLKTDAGRQIPIVIDHTRRCLIVDAVEMPMRSRALSILHYFLQRQQDQCPPLMQKAAVDDFRKWQTQTPQADQFKSGDDADFFRHELNHLRTTLRKCRCAWTIPVRSLVFPPFELTVR